MIHHALVGGEVAAAGWRVRNTPGEGLGFAIDGWRILRIDDCDAEPAMWQWCEVAPAPLPFECASRQPHRACAPASRPATRLLRLGY